MNRILLFIVLLLLTYNLNSANKVTLTFNHLLDGETFTQGLVSTSNIDIEFNISRLEYYISEIEITHDGGQKTLIQDYWILLNVEGSNSFDLGNYEIENIEGVKFSIGVDSAHNHLDPAEFPMEHPLSPKSPSMHWGWASGYRFVCLEGKAGKLFPDELFELHAIGDDYYYAIELHSGAEKVNEGLNIIVNADYVNTIFDIDVTGGMQIHGEHDEPIAMLKNFRDRIFSAAIMPTTVEDADIEQNVMVYPNPSSDGKFIVNVNNFSFSSDSDIHIYDLNGGLIKSLTVGPNEQSIHIANPGIYIVVVSDGQSKAFKKIIVE